MAINEDQAVQTMVERLRVLQATGETELRYRKVETGSGLTGGGDLTEDLRIELTQAARDALQKASESVSSTALTERLAGYISTQDMVARLNDYQPKRDAYRVWTAPYTYPGTLTQEVQAPPLVAVGTGVIESVGIAARTAGAEVVVTIGGRQFRLARGSASVLHAVGVPVTAGDRIDMRLASTNATGVTVNLRIKESA